MDSRNSGVHVYDFQTLLHYSNHATTNLYDDVLEKLCDLGLLQRLGLEKGRQKWCSRKRKLSKRGGIHAKLKTNPSQPAFLSILLSNVATLDNKLDYI